MKTRRPYHVAYHQTTGAQPVAGWYHGSEGGPVGPFDDWHAADESARAHAANPEPESHDEEA